MILKFEDIPYGSIFQEGGGRRKFIKVQDILPSGLISNNYRRVTNPDGTISAPLPFNAVDLNTGCTANCPDWLEYEIVKMTHFPLVKNQQKAAAGT